MFKPTSARINNTVLLRLIVARDNAQRALTEHTENAPIDPFWFAVKNELHQAVEIANGAIVSALQRAFAEGASLVYKD